MQTEGFNGSQFQNLTEFFFQLNFFFTIFKEKKDQAK